MCPEWCTAKHPATDPDQAHTTPGNVHHAAEGNVSTRLFQYDTPGTSGTPELLLAVTDRIDNVTAQCGLSIPAAITLATELLGTVNRVLPPSDQVFLLPPGMGYVPGADTNGL
jgi:hypothetical protein